MPTSRNPPPVSETVAGATPSFQATLYYLGEKRVAKVYGRQNVWGRIDLSDPQIRTAIMERELLCLKSLSPGLAPAIELVEIPGGHHELAITMTRLDPADFLEQRLERGDLIPTASFVRLARLLADYHFDATVCTGAQLGSQTLPDFLRCLLNQERDILVNVLRANHSTHVPFLRLYDAIDGYILKNESAMLHLQAIMSEPIVGHGDLKAQNIAFTQSGGEVFVVDSAPLPEWRVNTRRMDALFLDTELRLIGRTTEADVFWRAYDSFYRQHAQLVAESARIPDQTIEAVDTVSRFYRANIFFRLAQAGVSSHRAEAALRVMEQICADLGTAA